MAKVIFTYNGIETSIQCLKEDKMKNICNKYVSKTNININSLLFLYSGNTINFELSFKDQANKIDRERNVMNILVYKQNENGLKCPKCGERINVDKFNEQIQFHLNQNELINELKNEIEIINDCNEISKIKSKIRIINLIIKSLIEENEKYKNNIKNIINGSYKELNVDNKKNIIKGIFNVEDINQDVAIFNQYVEDEGFDVYLNDKKVDVIKSYKIQYKNFLDSGKGNYEYKVIFKNKIPNLERIFQNCSNLIKIDLSDFNTINTNSMGWMFNRCHKLKEIKGINKFITSKVTNMSTMFQECNEIEYLDLSNFDTSNVTDMGWMFFGCNKLDDLNLLNFSVKNNCNIQNMFKFNSKKKCRFITNNDILQNIYNS